MLPVDLNQFSGKVQADPEAATFFSLEQFRRSVKIIKKKGHF